MNQKKFFDGISGSTLKLFAIITMFIDHFGATVLRAVLRLPAVAASPSLSAFWTDVYSLSRNIGRLAFPIFCFLIVEGLSHTRNIRKYAGRLFLFALISEIPFDIALKGSWYFPTKQNVYFTLLIGLLVIIGISQCERLNRPVEVCRKWSEVFLFLCSLGLSFAVLLAGMCLANWLDTDYNYKGVFLIGVLYLTRHSRVPQCITGGAAVAWEIPAPLAFVPVYLYNGTRGRQMKYFFYWFYPVHLLVLHVIAQYGLPLLFT